MHHIGLVAAGACTHYSQEVLDACFEEDEKHEGNLRGHSAEQEAQNSGHYEVVEEEELAELDLQHDVLW